MVFFITVLMCCNRVMSQDTKIKYLIDATDSSPIGFAQIYNGATFKGTISDDNGSFHLTPDLAKSIIVIRHLGYEIKEIPYAELIYLDTLFLTPKRHVLPEFTVEGGKSEDLYKSINELLKNLRADDKVKTGYYSFYLESEIENKKSEKIKALIRLNYAPKSGVRLNDFYTEYGEFLFNPSASFFNLQTNELITTYAPFRKKSKSQGAYMPTNSRKITKKDVFSKAKILRDLQRG